MIKTKNKEVNSEKLLVTILIIVFAIPVLIIIIGIIFWIYSMAVATADAVEYYRKPKEKFCSKVCEEKEFKISIDKCICSNGKEYIIELEK